MNNIDSSKNLVSSDYGVIKNVRKPKRNLLPKIVLAASVIIAVATSKGTHTSKNEAEIITNNNETQSVSYMTIEIDNSPDIEIGKEIRIDANSPVYLNIYDATNESNGITRDKSVLVEDIETGDIIDTVTSIALENNNYSDGKLAFISREAFFNSRYSPYQNFETLDKQTQFRLLNEYKDQIDYWMKFAYEDCLDKGFTVSAIGTSTGFTNINDVIMYKEGRIKK